MPTLAELIQTYGIKAYVNDGGTDETYIQMYPNHHIYTVVLRYTDENGEHALKVPFHTPLHDNTEPSAVEVLDITLGEVYHVEDTDFEKWCDEMLYDIEDPEVRARCEYEYANFRVFYVIEHFITPLLKVGVLYVI